MVKIEILYPEICNLYGDLFNVRYLQQSMKECEIIETHLTDVPYFAGHDDIDMIYMGTTTEDGQQWAVNALRPFMDRIRKLIDEDVLFLITGNAFEIFGRSIINEDDSEISCLGLYDTVARRKMLNRYNSLFLGKYGDIDIVGYKSQFAHSYGDNDDSSLFKVTRGSGLNPQSSLEGFRIHNFMSTTVLGPLLVLNPLFAAEIMRLLGEKDPHPAYEDAAMKNYQVRLAEYLKPETVYEG